MTSTFTTQLKNYAKSIGADLVGIADPGRWANAPFNRSPQALMPDCTAAVVMGFHYLDLCVELGGQPDARYPGPSISNHIASEHGNYAAFRLCKYIERAGYKALMVPATGWWNYRPNEASPRGFAADITHYYAACAAGLGEIGWNNICMSPEFGPRQRWITVVTNAPLDFDPMYDGNKLCDGCKLCERHCPGEVFSKESEGTITIDFVEKSYTFKHKNLWRCALGENFQLDSFMDRPEKSDEKTMKKLCEDWAQGGVEKRFSWKMGMCLKWCMTHDRRYFDRNFTASPRRRRDVEADYTPEGVAKAYELMCETSRRIGISKVITFDQETLIKNGIDLTQYVSTAKSAVSVIQYYPENCDGDTTRQCSRNALWLAKELENCGGYDTMVESGIDHMQVATMCSEKISDMPYKVHTIITSIPFEYSVTDFDSAKFCRISDGLGNILKDIALQNGADLYGVSGIGRINEAAAQLSHLVENEDYFVSVEQGWGEKANRMIDMKGKPKNPKTVDIKLKAKTTDDYMQGAKSVIVIGLSMLNGSVDNVMKPPAYKGAHYGATVHKEMFYQNHGIALNVCKLLHANGYKAYITDDLLGLSSITYSFGLPDLRANNIPAVCAGLGVLGKNGQVINEKFGSRVRYVAIVTDAELHEDTMAEMPELKCVSCDKCIKACPAQALSESELVKINIEGKEFEFASLHRLRCDWAMRYGLMKEAGPKCLGSLNDYTVPEIITRENLVETIRESDRLQISNFAPIVEKCMIDCPYNNF